MLKSNIEPNFKLSEKFLEPYQGQQPEWGFGDLSYFTYKRTYARIMENGLQEEFVDTCIRVVEGTYKAQEKHCKSHGIPWKAQKAQASAQEMFRRMWSFKWLPPGRGLWMMGTEHVDKVGSAALNNCFSGDTEVLVQAQLLTLDEHVSVAKLSDLEGLDVSLLNQVNGKYVPVNARVEKFGQQKLQKVFFKPRGMRSNLELDYEVTADHRWILTNGESTTSLSVGDVVRIEPQSPIKGPDYKTGFAHGLIFGDGTRNTYYPNRHFIRLCGEKEQAHTDLLEKIDGYVSTTYPDSYNGDSVVTIIRSENWKALPKEDSSVSYLNGFVQGWIAADGHINNSGSIGLDTTNVEAAEWLVKRAPLVGLVPTGWSTDNQPTNFGARKKPLQRLCLATDIVEFKVSRIVDEGKYEEVFCPVVPDANQFALAGGLITGNCGFVSTEDINVEFGAPFSWSMDMLMLGVGIGFDTKGADRLTVHTPTRGPTEYIIPDTREGWVESVRLLLNSYGHHNSSRLTFAYHQIRPRGTPIRGFGGTASGPQPLIDCHESIREVLDALDGQRLTSVAIVDIFNFIGKCVVAGNVRRSAELAIGDIEDKDYVEMKDHNKFSTELSDRRWASNNSVFASRFTDFSQVADNILTNGEPGLIFLDNARHYGRLKDGWLPEHDRRYDYVMGFNPCAEQQLESYELCCLVETFPANHENAEDYMRTLKFAYLYAKSVTLIPTHDERTNSVIMRNRRIGTSMSGIQQAIHKFGRQAFLSHFCDEGYGVIKGWDRLYSRWFGVPESHRVTTVKPSGTVSLLAGATPGVHYTHSQAYWRTVRLSANSPLLEKIQDAGLHVEYSMTDWEKITKIQGKSYHGKKEKRELMEETKEFIKTLRPSGDLLKRFAEDNGTVVIYFPVVEKNFNKSKFDVTIWEQMQTVREMQYWWADNAVSCTITVKENERQDLLPAIEFAAPYVKTLSFLPLSEHGYEQAVYQEASLEDVQAQADSVYSLDLSQEKQTEILGSKFCDGDTCEI